MGLNSIQTNMTSFLIQELIFIFIFFWKAEFKFTLLIKLIIAKPVESRSLLNRSYLTALRKLRSQRLAISSETK